MRHSLSLALILVAACAHSAAPSVAAPAETSAAPGATPPSAKATAATCAEEPQPELLDMSSALATEQSALIGCMPLAAGDVHVTFVVDEYGRARNVAVNGATQGGATRCIRRALRRVSLRGRRACPTTGEFILAGLPGRRRSSSGPAWMHRARQ